MFSDDVTHTQDPRCSLGACDGEILRFLDETERMLVGFGEFAIENLVEHSLAVFALAMGLLDAVDVAQ